MFPLRKESDGYGSESEDNTRRGGEDREYRGARAPTQDAFWREERQERGIPWDRESKEKQGNSGHRAYGQIEWGEARENYASTSTSGGEWETGQPTRTSRSREEWSYRQGKDRVWTHAELLAQGATIEQINKMPIIEDNIPF